MLKRGFLLLFLLAGCPRTGGHERGTALLHILCEPRGATIFLDDRYVGRVESPTGQSLTATAGFHRLEVRRDGYFSHFAEVELAPGAREKLVVKLRKEPF